MLNSLPMIKGRREGYVRPNPPRRTGKFLGGYFAPELVKLVENEVYAAPSQTRTQVMAALMLEALNTRREARVKQGEGEK